MLRGFIAQRPWTAMLEPSVSRDFINDIGFKAEVRLSLKLIEAPTKNLEGAIKNCVE